MTPEIEVRNLLTNTLAAHLPARELLILGDAITLIVAHALDTALFHAGEQPRISAECQWLRDRWHSCVDTLSQLNGALRRIRHEVEDSIEREREAAAGWKAALEREESLLTLLATLNPEHAPS